MVSAQSEHFAKTVRFVSLPPATGQMDGTCSALASPIVTTMPPRGRPMTRRTRLVNSSTRLSSAALVDHLRHVDADAVLVELAHFMTFSLGCAPGTA